MILYLFKVRKDHDKVHITCWTVSLAFAQWVRLWIMEKDIDGNVSKLSPFVGFYSYAVSKTGGSLNHTGIYVIFDDYCLLVDPLAGVISTIDLGENGTPNYDLIQNSTDSFFNSLNGLFAKKENHEDKNQNSGLFGKLKNVGIGLRLLKGKFIDTLAGVTDVPADKRKIYLSNNLLNSKVNSESLGKLKWTGLANFLKTYETDMKDNLANNDFSSMIFTGDAPGWIFNYL